MLEHIEYSAETPDKNEAVDILGGELLSGETREFITEEMGRLTTYLFYSSDDLVSVASLDLSDAYQGDIGLKYLAVKKEVQGKGYGEATMEIILDIAREATWADNAVLTGSALVDVITFYTNLGASEDEVTGRFIFDLDCGHLAI